VLPPGAGAVVANVAVTLANKVAVNLNFTAGRAALQSAINRGQILHAISAKPVMKRLEDFPWPKDVFRLEELMPELRPKIVLWRLISAVTPAWLLSDLLGLPHKADRKEAVLLFTSGSSGEPKGVVLSHRNVLGNVMQFGSMLNLGREDSVMASLPFFHSFGCTVTLWYPMIGGVRAITYPTPVDVVKNAETRDHSYIFARISEAGRAKAVCQYQTSCYWSGKAAHGTGGSVRTEIREACSGGLWAHGNRSGGQYEPARSSCEAAD
jgi:acyl-[acyl-carrier-protein]-phospholipid O-acyltransferase/long-chain-fatty-acid--[acyl-carrier-protein] ligase